MTNAYSQYSQGKNKQNETKHLIYQYAIVCVVLLVKLPMKAYLSSALVSESSYCHGLLKKSVVWRFVLM